MAGSQLRSGYDTLADKSWAPVDYDSDAPITPVNPPYRGCMMPDVAIHEQNIGPR